MDLSTGNGEFEMLMPVYEGPEKKLEIILFSSMPGLRSDADGRWKRIIRAARAEIISKISTDFMDAYLLSESSLFVWENRILLITCGNTSPVCALPLILDIVGKDRVAFLFYEQRNFIINGKQSQDFEKDAAELSAWFPGKCFRPGSAAHDYVNIFHYSHIREKTQNRPCLQLLMHDLAADAMRIFCRNPNIKASEIRNISGLNNLYDPLRMMTDDHLFSPCGYSLNSIRGKNYFTVHVTPQPVSSYVSFETGIMENWQSVIGKVLGIFRPAGFSMMLNTGTDDKNFPYSKTEEPVLHGYSARDRTVYESDSGYAVIFMNYIREE